MRVLRLLLLAAILLTAYFAQYLFDYGTLAHLYPAWMLQRFPALLRSTLWLPDDLYTLALWLMGGSALAFGLLAPPWPAGNKAAPAQTVRAFGRGDLLLRATGLALLALLVGWGWTALPVRIDAAVAAYGLEAKALLAGAGGWLAPGVTGAPRLASLPLGLLAALLRSAPAGTHVLGLLAALATTVATYGLALELFAPVPQRRGLALLAAAFAGCTLATLHFGRLAAWLPATAAGAPAAWLLLVGARRGRLAHLAASGLLAAAALWLDRSGLVFALVLLAWWPGLRCAGRQGLAVWLACLLLPAAPLLLHWLLNPPAFALYLGGGQAALAADWWANLRTTAGTFFWTADASSVFGMSGPGAHFVNSTVAPLFMLGIGALLWNLDRPIGWRLLSWLAVALLFSSIANPLAPYWPALLPLLPLAGITIAFALDRMRALWEASDPAAGSVHAADEGGAGATGAGSATASLAVGLLVATAAITAVAYYPFAAAGGDPASYTGRALAALPPDGFAVLVASTPEHTVRLDDPVVQYAAGERAGQALAVTVEALPASLPAGNQIIVQGADTAALTAVSALYPQAPLEVVRDLNANPRLFVVHLP